MKTQTVSNNLWESFLKDLRRGWVSSEHWFTQNVKELDKLYSPKNFRSKTSYYEVPSGEQGIILENISKITRYTQDRQIVVWGAGMKEAELVKAAMREGSKRHITIIDIEKFYMDKMIKRINNLKKIRVVKIIDLFQNVRLNKRNPSFHIFLGTSIGNFDQEEIFRVLERNMKKGDLIMIGFELNKNPPWILKEYKKDSNFTKCVHLKIFDNAIKMKRAKEYWRYNNKKQQIEFFIEFLDNVRIDKFKLYFRKGSKVEVFRSKKYNEKSFSRFALRYSLETLETFSEGNNCIKILRKM